MQGLGLQLLGRAVQVHEQPPAQQQHAHAGDVQRGIAQGGRVFLGLEGGNQALDGQGHHNHHQKPRQETPHPRGPGNAGIAHHLLLDHGLRNLQRHHGRRQGAQGLHQVQGGAVVQAQHQRVPALAHGHPQQSQRHQGEQQRHQHMHPDKQRMNQFHGPATSNMQKAHLSIATPHPA